MSRADDPDSKAARAEPPASGASPHWPRRASRQVQVGGVTIGGGAPIRVQSMTNTKTTDAVATLAQIRTLADAGCELVRCAVPSRAAAQALPAVVADSPLPVIADVHFDHRLAIAAIDAGVAKVRINPGNIGDWVKVDAVVDAAGAAGIPLRVGVNAGSIDDRVRGKGLSLGEELAESAGLVIEHLESRGFFDIVVSVKANSVPQTVWAYRKVAAFCDYPLHLGVTEAGTAWAGTVKSATGLAILLAEGIGDTLRVSLTADPVEEVAAAWEILASLELRRHKPGLVSCPTCGRTEVDLIPIAKAVEERLAGMTAPLTVAVMGCVVNGPGEARDADVGVAAGKGSGVIFVKGEAVRKVPEEQIVEALLDEVERLAAEMGSE